MWLCPSGLGGMGLVRAELPYPACVGCFESRVLVTPSQTPALCVCEKIVPDCSSEWEEGTLSC